MKIWEKEGAAKTEALIEQFTVGNDRAFDLLLAKYDVRGTLAHIEMLRDVGMLETADYDLLAPELNAIAAEITEGRFFMRSDMEDVHSQIEWMLTRKLGEAGKKIHTGRSRNDQVLVDIKLYLKDEILSVKDKVRQLCIILLELSESYKHIMLPGYTHLQIAMPSSFGLWFGAWAECLTEDLEVLSAAYRMADKNPLGSGAGYGSSFPINREQTTHALGFSGMHYNVINAQLSRGRTEKVLSMAMSAIASTLGRMSMDICLYMGQNFGFLHFPDALTTGSSLMPHKKNPDIFELVRGRCNRIQSLPGELALLLANLPSGYHRDLQLTKEILFPAVQSFHQCLDVLIYALPQVSVNEAILDDERYRYLFSVEMLSHLIRDGFTFRDAYREVGRRIATGSFTPPPFVPETHTLSGSIGNLRNDAISTALEKICRRFGE